MPSTKWWFSLVNIQSLAVIGAAFASVVLFWNRQKDHASRIEVLEKSMINKAEKAEVKSMDEKVNRQYEQIRVALDRIIVVEKQLEYERGKHDGLEEAKKNNQ